MTDKMPEDPFNQDESYSITLHQLMENHMAAGFTRDEAFEIVMANHSSLVSALSPYYALAALQAPSGDE